MEFYKLFCQTVRNPLLYVCKRDNLNFRFLAPFFHNCFIVFRISTFEENKPSLYSQTEVVISVSSNQSIEQ